MIAIASVSANSRNNRPTTSRMKRSGISTASSDTVSEMMVKAICFEPLIAASKGASPSSIRRAMFSIITMASSTTNPAAMVSAMSDKLFTEKPAAYITAKVPTSDSGTATLGIMVAETLRRNRNITITTRATASINSYCTSRTDARIVVVRSVSVTSSTEAGSAACSCGRIALMALTVSITFAPGCRCTLITMPGC